MLVDAISECREGATTFRANRYRPFRRAGLALAAAVLLSAVAPVGAQEGILPGEAFLTKFSGTSPSDDGTIAIDLAGPVGVAVDLRAPGYPADGRHWFDEPRLFEVTAGDVGQVFGVAFDDASPPNVYLTATSAFGLHRDAANVGWMPGMWGAGGGPGTVYRLTAASGYQPEVFADISLDGRPNSSAALGNIAFDPWHRQFFVSDLETGMVHRLGLDGADLGRFDHGVDGRASFTDAATGAAASLPPVAFDPASEAHVADCPTGDFARTPSCWNLADFRRRVWGLDLRRDPGSQEVRLYYAVWGSQGFGNPDWPLAGEDQQNAVWSVAIADDGGFDAASVRREFLVPEFFRSPEAIARAGISHPVADIAFPRLGNADVMLLAERGGMRNLGLAADNAFSYPHESRVLRFERDAAGVWQPVGRYDVGVSDRSNEGTPYVRAGAAGGVAFGMGYGPDGEANPADPDGFVWMTGDGLCAPAGPCFDPATGDHADTADVSGLQGGPQSAYQEIIPDAAFRPYPAPGPATPATGPDGSYIVDVDINVDPSGATLPDELARNDATRIGDVAIYQEAASRILDLAIAKRALDPSCAAGGSCAFEVTITNVGEVAYSGPLVVRDTPAYGAALAVPPPSWDCLEPYPGVSECTLPSAELAVGASTSFRISFTVPTAWDGAVFSNCVELTTPGSGEDARIYNNSACGYAPTVAPGTPTYAPDLQLTKYGLDGQCDWFGNCLFVVRIANVGAASYSGPLRIRDAVDFPGAALANWAPAPDWVCGPVGADSFNCTYPQTTLAPGDFRDLTLWVAVGPIVPGPSNVRNCAWIDWGGSSGDYNAVNDYDCAGVSRFPPGHPGAYPLVDIEKKAVPACYKDPVPPGDWVCVFHVDVANNGGAPYFGPLEVSDVTDILPATLLYFGAPPPWVCAPGPGVPGVQTCTHPGVPGGLQPGQALSMALVFEVPAAVPPAGVLRNCASISADHDWDGTPEDYTSCAYAVICDVAAVDCPEDLGVVKTTWSDDPCYPGFECSFTIGVQNIGNLAQPAPLVFTDVPDPGFGPPIVDWPADLTCVAAGSGYTCTWPHALPPATGAEFDLSFLIPPDPPGPTFENCASVAPGPQNVYAYNDESCATAFVPIPDLHPFGATTCQRGADCPLDVGIENGGLLPFVGSAGVRGTLSPAVPIAGLKSLTSGLDCRVTGLGRYECTGQRLDIPARSSVEWEVTISVPADFAADEITHTKDMIWPDRAVKDKRPENDRHVSTITIEGPKAEPEPPPPEPEPQPPPPPPPPEPPPPPPVGTVAAPDLAIAKTADQTQCVAGRACGFTVAIRNVGAGDFVGPLQIDDVSVPPNTRLSASGPSPWSCRGSNGSYVCRHPTTTIAPGATKTLSLTLVADRAGSLQNCSAFGWSETGRVMAVQTALNALGFPAGTADGKVGPKTRGAIEAFQGAAGLPVTGQVDDAMLRRLFGSWGDGDANAGNDRACAATTVSAPPPPQVICAGGTVSNNQCVCPKGTVVQQTGADAYRCIKPPPAITCIGGKVQNNACVCPGGTEVQQTGPNAWQCVKVQPQIVCSGGKVQNNECVCPRGTVTQQTGPNAWQCVKVQPQIVCSGGKVKNNECVCPKGTEIQQTGVNAYKCVKVEVRLICDGGKIRGDKCVCPKGTAIQQIGPNAFRCNATVTPQLELIVPPTPQVIQ